MAVYFVGKYPEVYSELSNTNLLANSKEILSSTIDEINSELAGISGLLDELDGNYSRELANSLVTIGEEVQTMYTVITTGLTDALSNMDALSEELDSFKTNDESLEDSQGNLETEEANEPDKFITDEKTLERSIKAEWTEWNNRVTELKKTIEDLKKLVLSLKDNCDNKIDSLDQFNDDIVDIRLKMASIAFVQQGLSLDDIKNLTPEEKEKLINDIIDAMTTKYNEYKEKYENFVNTVLEDDRLSTLIFTYNKLIDEFSPYRYDNFFNTTSVTAGSELFEFFRLLEDTKTEDGRNLIECLDAYANGKSWVESGMYEFYKKNRSMDYDSQDPKFSEEEFRISLEWGSNATAEELLAEAVGCYRDNVGNVDGFMENYQNALKVGVSINGLKELEGHVKYDAYTLDPEFKGRDTSHWNDDFYDKLYIQTDIDVRRIPYLSPNESDMFRYIYDTQGADAAKDFMDSISVTLNRREGYIKGSMYYAGLIDGDNTGIDSILDHASIGLTGYGDGMVHYVDGFVDLVAPSKEMSVNEYAAITLIGRLTDGGSNYDNSLLTSYNIGNTLGKKTIPILLDVVKPGLGRNSEIVSDFGNSIEDYLRADDNSNYGTALFNATVDLAGDKGIDALAKATGLDSTPLGKLGVAGAKTLYGTTVKAARGQDVNWLSDLSGGLTKNMMGQLSGSMTDKLMGEYGDYLKSCGWSDDKIKLFSAATKPGVSLFSSATVEGGYEALKTGTSNIAYGKNDDLIKAFSSKFEDKLFSSGSTTKLVSDSTTGAASQYLKE